MAAYTETQIIKIGIDYELGKLSKSKIAQKWKCSRQTIEKWARDKSWTYAKSQVGLSKKIEKRAIAQLIEHSSDILADVEQKHIKNLDHIEHLTLYNLSKFSAIAKESGEVTKLQSETLHAAQKFLNEAVRTLNVSFIDKRKALGLDKEKKEEEPQKEFEDLIKERMIKNGYEV